MSNADINIMGVLNSITTDQTIAKAEQIEITLDNKKVKIPVALKKLARFVSGNELEQFYAADSKDETSDRVFICTKTENDNYKVGHIYFYDHGKDMITDITPATGGGGGGYDNGVRLDVSLKSGTVEANKSFDIPYTWTSKNIGTGMAYGLIDGILSYAERQTPGTYIWKVKPLDRGPHNLKMYVTDSTTLRSNTWEYSIDVGFLEINSKFKDDEIFKFGEDIVIPYEYYANDKTADIKLVYTLDDNIFEESINKDMTGGLALILSNIEKTGYHAVTMKIESTNSRGSVSYSNELAFNILVAQEGHIYAEAKDNPEVSIQTGVILNPSVRVAYIGAKKFTASFNVEKQNPNTHEYEKDPTINIPSMTWFNGINSFSTVFNKPGEYRIIAIIDYCEDDIILDTKDVVFTIHVQESELQTLDPISDGLILYLNVDEQRSNSETSDTIDKWIDITGGKRNPVDVKLHNFNFSTNGWMPSKFEQNKKQKCLVIDSGAYVEIDLAPFAKEIGLSNECGYPGFTFDIEFATKDIFDSNARVCSCFNGSRGFWINTEFATLHHSNNNSDGFESQKDTNVFHTPFPSEVKNRITFIISRGYKDPKDKNKILYGDYKQAMMGIYVNGVLTSTQVINMTDLYQNTGTKIYLGCDNNLKHSGYCEIYNVRAYNRALQIDEVLTNFIADIPNKKEQNDMIIRNRFGNSKKISLPVMYFILKKQDQTEMSKDHKVWGKVKYEFPDDREKSIEGQVMRCSWQGTSSLAYAVKNYKIKLYENKADSSGKYKEKWKYDLGNGIAENTFCLKADYMDSAHMRNTGTANFVNDFGTELSPAQEYIYNTRTAIYGYPIILYIAEPTPESSSAPDQFIYDEKTLRLIGVFNFNLDKSCMKSLSLYNKDDIKEAIEKNFKENPELKDEKLQDLLTNYPNWDCMSIEGAANSDESAGAFNSMKDQSIFQDFEMRFEDLDDSLEADDIEHIGSATYDIFDKTITISGINADLDSIYDIDTANNKILGYHIDLHKRNNDLSETILGDYDVQYDFKLLKNFLIKDEDAKNPEAIKNHKYYEAWKKVTEKPGTLTISQGVDGKYVVTHIENPEMFVGRYYHHVKKLIRWVLRSNGEIDDDGNRIEDPKLKKPLTGDLYKSEFNKHFNFNGTRDYYNIVFTLLLADNLGKNCMWNTWGPASVRKMQENPEAYKFDPSSPAAFGTKTEKEYIKKYDNYTWTPQFYDMDTCLGLNNAGVMLFDVDAEVEKGIFNTSNSQLWKKFSFEFFKEIRERYIEKREYNDKLSSFTMKSLNEYYYYGQIDKVSERDFNFDTVQKYLNNPEYLFMCHGRQYEYFDRWMSQRLYFLDSFYEFGKDWNAQSTVRVEYKDFATDSIKYHIRTYYPSYIKIQFTSGTGNSRKVKIPRNTEVLVEGYVTAATDQENRIFNAANIKSLGDISRYTPKLVELSAMERLSDLILGTDAYPNPNLTTVTLSNNPYLTKLVLENCTSCNSVIDVSNCTNLKYISTKGSSIRSINLNENGGGLEELKLSRETSSIVLRNFMVLRNVEIESLENLTQLTIKNCPLLTGDIKSEIPGFIYGNLLNKWEPTDINTSIDIDGYGIIGNYKFLDSVATLEEKYHLINLSGKIEYLGSEIPKKYSIYEKCFPNLVVTYDNVNDVSGMFKDYKNINSIWKKEIKVTDPVTGDVYSRYEYRWKNPRVGEFDPKAYDEDYDRRIEFYDDQDQEIIADEIREHLKPFTRFTNMSEMFMNDIYIEKIHPDTFDNIDVSEANNTYLFDNCQNLKYIECPKFNYLNAYAFHECNSATIWIPETVKNIDSYAFICQSYSYGVHQLLLFQSPESRYMGLGLNNEQVPLYISNGRDCRFGIQRQGPRAIKREQISCPNIFYNGGMYLSENKNLLIDYFIDENNYKLIKDIYEINPDGTINKNLNSIHFSTWNLTLIDPSTGQKNVFSNPLNIHEMLYGSMKRFALSDLTEISIPCFDIKDHSNGMSRPFYQNEISLLKLFFDEVEMGNYRRLPNLSKVNIITKNTAIKISDYFLSDSTVANVEVEKDLVEIGLSAFSNSLLKKFSYQEPDLSGYNIKKIGDYAFSHTKIENIFIPNSVTEIGIYAFSYNSQITSLKYSEAMTIVPEGCFAECNNGPKSPSTTEISGFSNKITKFENFAFDRSTGLLLVAISSKYDSYWQGTDSSAESFFDYFPNLEYIGDYAFRDILNIRTIKLNSKIQKIGISAFSIESLVNFPTRLIWVNPLTDSYQNTAIHYAAFSGREFDWKSNINEFDQILPQTIFVPASVGSIERDAFVSSSVAYNRFVLTNAKTLPENWNSNFSSGELIKVFDYFTSVIASDDTIESIKSLYFLKNSPDEKGYRQAMYARLLIKETSSIKFPIYVTYYDGRENLKYYVTEIAPEALVDRDRKLNDIIFAAEGNIESTQSRIKTIGEKLFTSTSVQHIFVEGSDKIIPSSILNIGKNIPFKNTNWFRNIQNDEFIYLNDICIGYAKGETPLESKIGNSFKLKDNTRIIYDKAFQNEKFASFILPSKLESIYDSAFSYCGSLESISFEPCKNYLKYIGRSVFRGDYSLKEMIYTKNITHVGTDATADCPRIKRYVFEKGCTLDNSSSPITPNYNDFGLDDTITDLEISNSMGEFFSPNGVGSSVMMVLSNIKNLVLGDYQVIKNLPPVSEEMVQLDPKLKGKFVLDLAAIPGWEDQGIYIEHDGNRPVQKHIILYTSSSEFKAPISEYEHDIDISAVLENTYEESDIVRIVMGYVSKQGIIYTIKTTRDVINKAGASKLRKMFNNRVSFMQNIN